MKRKFKGGGGEEIRSDLSRSNGRGKENHGKANVFSGMGKKRISQKNLPPCLGNHFFGKAKEKIGRAEPKIG